MVFSDQAFVFIFLTVALLICVPLMKTKLASAMMLILSLAFFYWSSEIYTLLLVFNMLLNFFGGLAVQKYHKKALLFSIIFINFLALGYFKYTYFIFDIFNFFQNKGLEDFATSIVLPIGISFYTFQGVSYVIDVWRDEVEAEHNPILFGAYLSFFPQLIAGPIVRYKDVESDFHNPTLSTDMVAAGVSRFLLGLFKKVCIADVIAKVADAAFTTPVDNLTFATAWLGAIAYSMQIYFDFSGYSDMAIGLGSMFGIRFPENFNHPYAAATITEFWRRWHISLSSWFRDYLYIPLGGNRLGASRTYINLFIVFLATGIWHGAAWTFVLWGLWHGAFLMVERLVFQGRAAQIQWPTLRLLYLFPAVIFGWVLFRAPNIAHFCAYSLAMLKPFSNQAMVLTDAMLIVFSPTAILASLIAGCALIMQNQFPTLGSILSTNKTSVLRSALRLVIVVAACLICAAYVIPQDFSPFLYFRF